MFGMEIALGGVGMEVAGGLFFEFLKNLLVNGVRLGSLNVVSDLDGSQVPPPSCEGWNEQRSTYSLAHTSYGTRNHSIC